MISRMRLMLAIVLTFLAVFTGRLMFLQLALSEELTAASEENFTKQVRISPLRGRILARDGTVLADNRVAYDLVFHGGDVRGWDRLQRLLDIEGPPRPPDPTNPDEVRAGAVQAWNIPDALIAAVEERVAGQPNLELRERVERTYPTNLAAQVIGYTGLADPARHAGRAVDELIGVMGIESSFDAALFGDPGAKLVEVDNRNVPVRETELWPARPGRDVVLTLDPSVQRMAEDALGGALRYMNEQREENELPPATTVRGALLAMELDTGDIVAMASSPSFDQNLFTRRPSDPDAVSAILNDGERLPLQNRSVEAYPPASTFKVVTSSTLLESGYVRPETRYECTASIRYGGITWQNWATYYRGDYTAAEAIADSCNTYYWRAALDTPDVNRGWAPFIEDLVERAHDFGFGELVGVGLDEEKPGRVPDDAWKRRALGEPWYPGNTLNTTIGQGDVLATPLQTLQFVGTLALEGTRVQPRLVRRVGEQPTDVIADRVEGRHWDTLAKGMRQMVTDHGSSRFIGPAANFPVAVAGKTGTAENGFGPGLEHVWFMAYAPFEDPDIAAVVFIETAGSSSAVAVPAMRDFLAAYYGFEIVAER